MKNNKKKTIAIILMIVVLLLGGAGVYVAYLLQRAAVPTAPTSIPRAADWYGGQSCNVNVVVAAVVAPTPASCNNTCSDTISCTDGLSCVGGACRNPACDTETDCTCPEITATATPTETVTEAPPAACRGTCSSSVACDAGLTCVGGMCRNSNCSTTDDESCVCPTTVTEAPPAACRGTCSSSVACDAGLTCVGGMCRNSNCSTTDDESCVCPTTVTETVTETVAPTETEIIAPTEEVTATPTEEILYETGVLNLPGAAAFGGGLLLVVLGILFAL